MQARTLTDYCRERGISDSTGRKIFDRILPDGLRAGLYRLVRDEDIPVLDKAFAAAGLMLRKAASGAQPARTVAAARSGEAHRR